MGLRIENGRATITKNLVVRGSDSPKNLLRHRVLKYIREDEPFIVTGLGAKTRKLISLIRTEYPKLPMVIVDRTEGQPWIAVIGAGEPGGEIVACEPGGEIVAGHVSESSTTRDENSPKVSARVVFTD